MEDSDLFKMSGNGVGTELPLVPSQLRSWVSGLGNGKLIAVSTSDGDISMADLLISYAWEQKYEKCYDDVFDDKIHWPDLFTEKLANHPTKTVFWLRVQKFMYSEV